MQQSYSSSTKAAALSMANHCKALVSRSQQSSASMRELAAYHSKLAGGATIQAGIGLLEAAGPRPTNAELSRLAASAETAADHRSLAAYFTSMATRYGREAADHLAYAKTWKGLTRNAAAPAQAASHERVANELLEAAKEARVAASMHGNEATKAK
jgi:antirestriction protein ArdC